MKAHKTMISLSIISLIIAVLFFTLARAQGAVANQQPLASLPNDFTGERAIVADTGSMLPTLHGGEIVIMSEATGLSDVQIGQVIVFSQNGLDVIHRVVSVGTDSTGWYAITRGDNNPSSDGKIRFWQVVGIVQGIVE